MAQGYGKDVEERPPRDLVEVVSRKIWPAETKSKRIGFIQR